MRGMDRNTGKALEGVEHLRQSILDILTTPVGTRVMNREYGSRLFELVDSPVDQRFEVEIFAAVADAINRWEPRFKLDRVQLVEVKPEGPVFDLYGVDLETGRGVTLEAV
jgi:phage baseplate assembly protein W